MGTIKFNELGRLLRGSFIFDSMSIVYLNCLFILLSLLPFRFRGTTVYQNVLFWLYTVTNSLGIIVFNLCDTVYFYFAQKRFTSEELHFVKEDTNNLPIICQALKDNFWLVFVGAALIFLMVYAYRKVKYRPTEIKNPWIYYPVNTVLMVVLLLVSFAGSRGSFHIAIRPYTLSNAAYYTTTPQKANLILSNPFCLLRTLRLKELDSPHYYDQAELESIYTPYHYPDTSSINLGKRNILIFVMESFSKEHSKFYCPELYKNEDGYTPFLDSLMQHSYVFINAFSNGMKSIEALPSILTSIPSYKKSFILLPQSLGKINGLPSLLSNEGYSTSFFCGAERSSMGFEAFCKMAGVNNFYSRENYEKERKVNEYTMESIWGVYDMPFYLYMADKLDDMPKPFFASVFNLTSHHPFRLPPDYQNKVPKGHTKVQPCVAYTDMALREFFNKAKTTSWYDSTIFVFVADHVSPEIYAPQTRVAKGHTRIFCFIYTPDHALQGGKDIGIKDTNVTQQMDLMPTLLGLTGYNKPYFAFGRDVFNEKDRLHIATNYLDQVYQCITDSVTVYFNDNTSILAYSANDTMQKNNILDQHTPAEQHAERYFKAISQTYYDCLKNMNYTVKKK